MLVISIAAGGYYWYSSWDKKDQLPVVPEEVKLEEVQWTEYKPEGAAFVMSYPEKWEVIMSSQSGAFDQRIFFRPRKEEDRIGNAKEVTLTIVSKPAKTQKLATFAEFNALFAQEFGNDSSTSAVRKLGNTSVGGEEAVILTDLSMEAAYGKGYWSVTSWFRHQNVNYYLNTYGDKGMSLTGGQLHTQMGEKFSFTGK